MLKRVLWTFASVCLSMPVFAGTANEFRDFSLSISANVARRIDPSLQVFIQQIWSESPAVKSTRAALEASRARGVGAGRPLYNPSLTLDAQRADIGTTSIGLSQTIDWGDKRGALTNIASSESRAAEATLIGTRQSIAVEALYALARYQTAQTMRELAQRRSDLMKRFADTVRKRYSAGDMNALDASLARVAYSESLMQQAVTEGDLAESAAALQAVTGLDLTTWPMLPQELSSLPDEVDEMALIKSLPRLVVLQTQVDAARARVQLARRENRPDPTIGIRGGREGSTNLFGLTLEIPLFVRNDFTAEAQSAAHDADQKAQDYLDAERRSRAQLEGALHRFQNMIHAWQAWTTTGQQAHAEQADLLEQLWQAEELTASDYLVQAKQSVDTQAAATSLVGDVWQAAIAWLDASGQIENWLGVTPALPVDTSNSGELK